jgi:hypothetical protein
MKKDFFAYIKPTDDEYREFWHSCIFTFDTNIFLNFYRYKAETTNTFIELLEKLGDRIFITHQACYEYFRNRLDVISEQEKAYSEVRDALQKQIEDPLQNQRKHPYLSPELLEEFLRTTAKIKQELDDRSREYSQQLSNDIILEKLIHIFDDRIGNKYTEERLNEIYQMGDKRYNQNVPPGFKDKNKGGTRQYGDLVLWFQIMDLAKEKERNIIFITDDEKEDWLYLHKGRTISLLPELQNEFFEYTGKRIHIYTAYRFIELYGSYFDSQVTEETINEIRTVQQENVPTESIEIEKEETQINDDEIDFYLYSAIRAVENDDGWAELAPLGLHLIRYTPLNYRNFGYPSLRKFIESRKIFEVKALQKSPNAKAVDSAFVRFKEHTPLS